MNDRTRIRIFEPTRRWRLSTVIVVAAAAAARVAAYSDRERYFISRLSIPQNRAQPNIHGSSSINPLPLPNPLSSPILRLPRTNASPTSQRRNPSPSKNTRIEQKFTNTIVINIFTILRTFISQDISMDRPSRCYIYIYNIYIWNSLILLSSLVEAPPFIRSLVRSFVRTRWGKNWKAVMEVERSTLLRRSFDSHVRVNVNRVGMGRGRAARTWTHAFIFPSTETWHTVRTGGRPRSRRSHWRVAGWLCEPPDSSTGAMEPARDARGVARQRGMEGGGWIERWTAEGGVGGVGWTERRRVGV